MNIKIWQTDQRGRKINLVTDDIMEYVNTDVIEQQGHPGDIESGIVNIHDDICYQTFGGIGGAITDSSAALWSGMPDDKKEDLIKAYYDRESGIGYTLARVSMGSCDFSTEDYTYVREGDETLDSFDIAHDKQAVFPMLTVASEQADLTVFASPWSPPAYMKTNGSRIGGHLKKEYYALWAKYFRKYIEACAENGIAIRAVTMQNEPRHHQVWESCLYTPEEEAEFLGYLGRELSGSGVKILCYDHCRERVFERAKYIYESENGRYCSGIAHHWYSGDHFGELRACAEKYPDKLSVASEGCCIVDGCGIKPETDLSFAEQYAHDMIGCFNSGLNYYCDWNILLDENNGPYHNREGRPCSAEAPVYYIKAENRILYRLSYYYIGHISKFVKPGAKIAASSSFSDKIEAAAFKNTDGSIVCVLLNRTDEKIPVVIRLDGCIKKTAMEPHSIATAVILK